MSADEQGMVAEGDGVLAASQLVEALRECGVEIVFANLGSDHPAIIEALAAERDRGIISPAIVLCPHEQTAISAAHGYSSVTGKPSAVFVHTDVGTANLGGALHNAARARVPVLVFAGVTPYTLENELPGGRNTVVNDLQDVHDQHGIVRPYVKWSYDLRTGRNIKQVIYRALQIAASEPRGPVYVTAAREVLAEIVPAVDIDTALWPPIESIPASVTVVDDMLTAIDESERPVLVTSYLGRHLESVAVLADLAEKLGFAVVEMNPERLNLPAEHPRHVGNDSSDLVANADLIMAVDTDTPWLPNRERPSASATVYYVDPDPLKLDMPLWYRPSSFFVQADSGMLLRQLAAASDRHPLDATRRRRRVSWIDELHGEMQRRREERSAGEPRDRPTSAFVGDTLRRLLGDDAIVLNEAITNGGPLWESMRRTLPGTYLANRGSSLGWSSGAALGVKAAYPSRDVVSVVGDGAYHLSEPLSAHWLASRYGLATLTVVLDNGGWGATQNNVRRQYAGRLADTTDQYWVNLAQSTDFAGAAVAATDAFGKTVASADELEPVLSLALEAVRGGQPALVHVLLASISAQTEDRIALEPGN